MIEVKALPVTKSVLEELSKLISYAAKRCYQKKVPAWGELLDIENQLFKTGHHSTMEHAYLVFDIEGISTADVTFGLHLTSQFYNSSQRSGRFSKEMYLNPDYRSIMDYVKTYWPQVSDKNLKEIENYIRIASSVYIENIERAIEKTGDIFFKERAYPTEKGIAGIPKIAQEQLRVFNPLIFPTGLVFSLDLVSLFSLYRSAWSPVMRDVTQKMADIVLAYAPEMAYVFNRKENVPEESFLKLVGAETRPIILSKPCLELLSCDRWKVESGGFVCPEAEDTRPVDLLHFSPKFMENNIGEIKTSVMLSAITMGQDQRHRMIRRSLPQFTGQFYLPPVPRSLGLARSAKAILKNWLSFSDKLPLSLVYNLAPLGAVVTYVKVGSFNAVLHETEKRLCWCAQEEIYHLALSLRKQLSKWFGKKVELGKQMVEWMSPPCFNSGTCGESARYCGRKIQMKTENVFKQRSV